MANGQSLDEVALKVEDLRNRHQLLDVDGETMYVVEVTGGIWD